MDPQLPVWYYSTPSCSCSSPHSHNHTLNNSSLQKRLFLESAYDSVRFSPYFSHRFEPQTKDFSKVYSKANFSLLRGAPDDEESKTSALLSNLDPRQNVHIKTEKLPKAEDDLAYDGLPISYSSPRFSLGMAFCGYTSSESHTGNDHYSQYSEEKPRRKGRKRRRTTFTDQQLQSMEKEFDDQKYIGGLDRQYLADSLGLTEKQVQVWFQNRRNKWRRESQP